MKTRYLLASAIFSTILMTLILAFFAHTGSAFLNKDTAGSPESLQYENPQLITKRPILKPRQICIDNDSDGYGNPGDDVCPNGNQTDCNDLNATIYPGAPEVCDLVDQDCDGDADEGFVCDCSETDATPGPDYDNIGTTSGTIGCIGIYCGPYSFTDWCNGDYVAEFYCDTEGRLQMSTQLCADGCTNGACDAAPFCTDSDGGDVPETAGTVNHNTGSYPDACIDAFNVQEYYCDAYLDVVSTSHYCELGCWNGACGIDTNGDGYCDVNCPPGNGLPSVSSFHVVFPYQTGYGERNSDYPEYEYAYTGNILHIMVQAWDQTVPYVDGMDADAILTCPNPVADRVFEVNLARTSNPISSGAGYKARFEGDLEITERMDGDCLWSIRLINPAMKVFWHEPWTNPLYENVDEVLANQPVTITVGSGLSWGTLKVNMYNNAQQWPVMTSMDSNDDKEGQGVLMDAKLRVSKLVGKNYPADIIYPNKIRYKTGSNPALINLDQDENIWNDVGVFDTDGTGYNEQFYFQLYYDANHMDWEYNGGVLAFLIEIV
ncbi:putative metal-binding motif-containing protein [Candidatus Woesearchaeota archaeon]|nr:putative metal-binding motif-containing protein [Candidatus Woesearchaeota archaeon]